MACQPAIESRPETVELTALPTIRDRSSAARSSYKRSATSNTVGVSAVRDLFGTMQNEGASKGILVTTSGYGKASFEFAQNKPLELLSGSNLLSLLEEHAGITPRSKHPRTGPSPRNNQPAKRKSRSICI